MVWSALLGLGSYTDMAVDSGGAVYLVGSAGSGYPVTPGALQSGFAGGPCVTPMPVCSCPLKFGFCPLRCQLLPPPNTSTCTDAFVSKINADGTALLYSTYLGSATTTLSEIATDITLDAAGNVYVIGIADLPATPGAFQSSGSGFIAKLTIGARSTAVAAVSAASYQGPQLAQESLAVGFLDAFGAGAENLRARVRDSAGTERDAQVFFSGFGQVNFQIPPETVIGDALVKVTSGGGVIASGALQVVKVAPGVFSVDASGGGLVAAVALRQKPDNTQTYEPIIRFDPTLNKIVAIPIDLGPDGDRVFLAIFGTGWRFRSSETAAKVVVGGVEVPVLYVGAQGTFRGVDQINVELTRALTGKGEVDLEVMVDGKAANTTRVDIK